MALRCAGPNCSILHPALRWQMASRVDGYCACQEALELADERRAIRLAGLIKHIPPRHHVKHGRRQHRKGSLRPSG